MPVLQKTGMPTTKYGVSKQGKETGNVFKLDIS